MKLACKILATLAALVAAGCGLPLPTDGAADCGRGVYIEVGVDPRFTCATALSYTRNAEKVVEVDLSGLLIEYMAGENLAELGQPNAWGRHEGRTIAVNAFVAVSVIHEALHERYGNTHCNWSTALLPLLEANYVPGAFDDECARVHCTSTNFWTDGMGQSFGNRYVCN